ncbi:CPBP family intramembrane glutamic endopeptidase [Anaerosporobacter mobilis]|uniref:CPBP family intramembrane glutamic endopeptidase n=1 Tax=Anaerosporobacter mobilis TaxID=264463 RepID=UPI0038B6CA1A
MATLCKLCAALFAVWHLPSYGNNLPQALITIIPARLVLNYLFKKTDLIWVTWVVHVSFDIISFLPILLK